MKSRRAEGSADLVVGVDAGGSSTRAAVVDRTGRVVGYATGAAGNPTSSGPEIAAANVVATLRSALPTDAGAPSRIAVAMAGASTAPEGWLDAAVAAAGIPGTVSLEADLAAIYLSGSRARLGYALLAGTGAIAARLVDHGIEAVADGLGWLLGDAGSGFWIGHRVIRAVAAELDGRGGTTAMTAEVLAQLDEHPSGGDGPLGVVDLGRTDRLDRMMAHLYADRPVRLARFAPVAFRAADAGDAIAAELVADAAALLAGTLGAVLTAETALDAPVVLGGSILAAQPRMADTVKAELTRRGLRGEISTVPDGVLGSVVLALEGAGTAVDDALAERIAASLAERRG